uniref:HNH endonuclease n=1 Tax=Marseillevirus LCMAC101 TaxID=2506602 RepID=A0A481YS10_9VIRU|nr:MAG: HNH endonuclease [Marseillevirus LCMAC101]
MSDEKWKDFPVIHGRSFSKYEVSSLGRIRNRESGYIFSTKPKDDRYVCNSFLDDEGKSKTIRAHVIVARAFLGNPDSNDLTVDHINQEPTDNRLVNLRWATKKQQTVNSNKSRSGSIGQPIVQYTADMKEIKTWPSIITAANKLGIDPSGITKACKGKLNHTGGYKWAYERQDLDGEIWKEYKLSDVQVSNMGRIKPPHYHIVYGSKVGGYMTYGKPVKGVHVMVAKAFLPNPENKPEVNHKDNDGTNNKLENLEWATRSEQMFHSHKTNSNPDRYSTAKAVNQYDLEGNFICEYRSRHEASKQTGCSRTSIFRVCSGRAKSTNGFVFTYSNED